MPFSLAGISSNPIIKEYAQGFAQTMVAPVADFLAPTVDVTTLVGRFKKYTEDDRFKIVKAERAIGGRAATIGFSATDASYNCTPRALDFPMDYLEMAEEAALEDLFMEGTQMLAEQATLSHEVNVLTAAVNNLTAGAVSSAWSGTSTVDPVGVVDGYILQVIKAARYGSLGGVGVLFGATAWKNFKNNAAVKGRFIVGKATGAATGLAVPSEQNASQLFLGNPEIRTSYMVSDTAAEGLAPNIQFLLDTSVIVFAKTNTPTRRDPSFMKTFRKMGEWMVPGSYVREDGRGETAKMDWSEDVQITNASAGVMITTS